jgi:hypothetical protein
MHPPSASFLSPDDKAIASLKKEKNVETRKEPDQGINKRIKLEVFLLGGKFERS